MNKIFIIFFFFISLVSNALADIINDIEVKGNLRLSKQSIIIFSGLNINQDYNSDDLNIAIKKLDKTDFFNKIDFKVINDTLLIEVIENPIIEDLQIRGVKSKSFVKALNEKMELKNRKPFKDSTYQSDLNLIKNIIKQNGYYFSKIETSLTRDNDRNTIRLFYDIDLGKKAKISEIIFLGDKKLKDRKLRNVIASETSKPWKFISNKVYLNQSLIDLDRRLLENFYKNQGYYDVKVLNSFAELNNQDSFKLIFNIDSGNKYYFNKFSLSLPDDYNKSHFDKINKIFKKLQNEKYSLNKIELILKEIDRIASMRLYDFITAQVDETIIDDNKLNFNFKVIDSEKFYIEKINILGNFNTIEEVIRNKLIVDEGDPFNELLFEKSIDNIRSTGFFKSVKTDISDGSSQNLKVVNLSVEEKPTGEISLGAGVGTAGSTIGGGIVEKNFLGKGINLNTNLEISEETVKGQFIYSKPNFNYSDNTLFTSVSSVTEDYLTDFGYKVDNIGFSVGTTFEQKENLFFSPEINIAFEDLETNSTASNNLKKQEGSYDDLYFNYSLDYDMRDSRFRPTSGNKVSFYQEMPFISNTAELTNVFIFTQYKKLNDASNMIGKASFYAKSVNTIKDSDARISKRAQVPYKRLRGFQRGKVGPLDNNDYIGGNYVSALNLSTNLPSIFSTVEIIDFSLFMDFANVWGVDYNSSIDDSNKLRSTAGIGMDVLTPVGPLSFSLSQPITKNDTDKTETFRFNLGTTF